MKLDPKRIDALESAPEEVRKALYLIGDYLNDFRAGDINANFTIHRNGESITYEFAAREVKRLPTYIDVD